MDETGELGVKSPFKNNVVISPDIPSGRFFEFENNPDYIIRRTEFYKDPDEPLETAQRHRKYFEELKNKYGVAVPDFRIAISDTGHRGEVELIIVVDKVRGNSLYKVLKSNPTQDDLDQIEDLYIKLAHYIQTKVKNKEMGLADIMAASDYVLGATKKDPKPEIYLVDLDMDYDSNFNLEAKAFMPEADTELMITHLALMVIEASQSSGYSFDKAKASIQELLNSLSGYKPLDRARELISRDLQTGTTQGIVELIEED